jgi:predicted RNA-binding Zn ribbon-like protein
MERCLEFANTVHWHASARPEETLRNYSDLLAWARQAGIVVPDVADRLMGAAEKQPEQALDVFQRAIGLREAIYGVFAAHVHDRAPAENDLARINAELALALSHQRLEPVERGFEWAWAIDAPNLAAVIWPIVRSAADLLTAAEILPRVGQCADDRGCGWLFLDLSKNHSRRWCDINDCGNRAKQRRHYARTRRNTTDDRS